MIFLLYFEYTEYEQLKTNSDLFHGTNHIM